MITEEQAAEYARCVIDDNYIMNDKNVGGGSPMSYIMVTSSICPYCESPGIEIFAGPAMWRWTRHECGSVAAFNKFGFGHYELTELLGISKITDECKRRLKEVDVI